MRGEQLKRTNTMPVDFDRKIAFIHVPKTAGTSIEYRYDLRRKECFFEKKKDTYTFDNIKFAPQHLRPKDLAQLIPDFEEYKTFCFIRHPYEKMISEYYWLHKDLYGKPIKYWNQRLFRKWLIEEASKKDRDHLLPQSSYTKDCNYVFLLENLNKHIEEIDHWFGKNSSQILRHDKKGSRTKEKASRLNRRTQDLIYALYREDFDILGFDRHYLRLQC